MPSRVCDESRIPFPHLPTAAAAGPSSNNWTSEPRSKLSTLASFRHLRLLLLLVFRVIYIKQNKPLIYLDLMHCQWWTRVETWRVTKCQMPHSCFARVLSCRDTGVICSDYTQPAPVWPCCIFLLHLVPEILELMQWGHHLFRSIINILFFLWEILKTWTLRDKVTEINGL